MAPIPGRKLGFGSGIFWGAIRHLVTGPDLHENRALIEEVAELEDRVSADAIFSSTTRPCSSSTTSGSAPTRVGRALRHLVEEGPQERPELLNFERSLLLREEAAEVDPDDHPEEWHADGLDLPISYTFEPGAEADGVTVDSNLADLGRVSAEPFEWQIPGLPRSS